VAVVHAVFKHEQILKTLQHMQQTAATTTTTVVSTVTKELKTAHGHMMPPPLHLSDIRCKYFPLPWKAKRRTERTDK